MGCRLPASSGAATARSAFSAAWCSSRRYDSAILAAASTRARVLGWTVAAAPLTSTTPSRLPFTGSRIGAAAQVHAWWVLTKCSAE